MAKSKSKSVAKKMKKMKAKKANAASEARKGRAADEGTQKAGGGRMSRQAGKNGVDPRMFPLSRVNLSNEHRHPPSSSSRTSSAC